MCPRQITPRRHCYRGGRYPRLNQVGLGATVADQIDAARNQGLVAKIELVEDPDSSRAYAAQRRHEIIGTAEVKTASATVSRRRSLGETKGGPSAPMSAEMTESKFLEATSLSLTVDNARQLLERLRRVEEVTDVSQLFEG